MLILPDYGFTYNIIDGYTPMIPKYNWVYNSVENDFYLKTIKLLEETTGPTLKVNINNLEFYIPASWYILVMDTDTKTVDTVQVSHSANYKVFLTHPNLPRYEIAEIYLIDIIQNYSCIHVMMDKTEMMLHPISEDYDSEPLNCLLSPYDQGKNIYKLTAMELLI